MPSSQNFIAERLIFERETLNGKSLSLHGLRQFFTQIPGIALIGIICTAIIYPMVGLNDIATRFWWFFHAVCHLVAEKPHDPPLSLLYRHGHCRCHFRIFHARVWFFCTPEQHSRLFYLGYYIAFLTYAFELFMWTEFHRWSSVVRRGLGLMTFCPRFLFRERCFFLAYYEMDISNGYRDLDVGNSCALAIGFRAMSWLFMVQDI